MKNEMIGLVDVRYIAKYFKCTKKFVYRCVQREEIPYYHVGRRYRFDLEEVKNTWRNKVINVEEL